MMRFIFGVLAGLIIFYLVWIGIDYLSFYFFPIEMKPFDGHEDFQQFIERLPLHKQIIISSGYIIGSLLAGFICSSISKQWHIAASIIISTLIVAMAVTVYILFPQPLWMTLISFIAPIPFTILGSKIAQRPS